MSKESRNKPKGARQGTRHKEQASRRDTLKYLAVGGGVVGLGALAYGIWSTNDEREEIGEIEKLEVLYDTDPVEFYKNAAEQLAALGGEAGEVGIFIKDRIVEADVISTQSVEVALVPREGGDLDPDKVYIGIADSDQIDVNQFGLGNFRRLDSKTGLVADASDLNYSKGIFFVDKGDSHPIIRTYTAWHEMRHAYANFAGNVTEPFDISTISLAEMTTQEYFYQEFDAYQFEINIAERLNPEFNQLLDEMADDYIREQRMFTFPINNIEVGRMLSALNMKDVDPLSRQVDEITSMLSFALGFRLIEKSVPPAQQNDTKVYLVSASLAQYLPGTNVEAKSQASMSLPQFIKQQRGYGQTILASMLIDQNKSVMAVRNYQGVQVLKF